jgi:hypothetical protein
MITLGPAKTLDRFHQIYPALVVIEIVKVMIIPVDQLTIQFLFTQYSLRRLLYNAYPQLPPYRLLIPLNTILQSSPALL